MTAERIADHNSALPAGYLLTADQVMVSVDGVPLRVLRYAQFDVPIYFVHASLAEKRDHEVSVCIRRYQYSCLVHPRRLGICPPLPNHKKPMSFTIHGNPHLVVDSDGLGYLLLAFDPAQEEPAGAGVIRAGDLGVRPDVTEVQTAAIQRAIDRVSDDPALRTLVLPPGMYRSGDLHLKSNCRLHLAAGAVLKASDRADDMGDPHLAGWDPNRAGFINAHGADGFSITGHGHIDGNRGVLSVGQYHKPMVQLTDCRHVLLDGVVLSDSCNWNTHLRACDDVTARRIKVLNNRPILNCINTDGINPDCSRRVTIEHCLMHTGDDAVAVKSCGHGDGLLRDVSDILVTDLLAINNSTTAKIGTETCAGVMERITFRRVDAVHTARLCVVDAFDRAEIRDVVFEDCHVHRLDDRRRDRVASDRRLIDLHAPAETWRPIIGRSRISRVVLRDIRSDEPAWCVLTGRSGEYGVDEVRMSRITVAGRALTGGDVRVNEFVSGLTVD